MTAEHTSKERATSPEQAKGVATSDSEHCVVGRRDIGIDKGSIGVLQRAIAIPAGSKQLEGEIRVQLRRQRFPCCVAVLERLDVWPTSRPHRDVPAGGIQERG